MIRLISMSWGRNPDALDLSHPAFIISLICCLTMRNLSIVDGNVFHIIRTPQAHILASQEPFLTILSPRPHHSEGMFRFQSDLHGNFFVVFWFSFPEKGPFAPNMLLVFKIY